MKLIRNGVEILNIKDYKVVGKFMDVAYIDCTIKSPTIIDFAIGDKVHYDYWGIDFSLYDIPTPKKQARRGTYGEAFIYELKLKADTQQLVICPFLDLVPNDNKLQYSSLPGFSTFENVYGIADRIQANIDYLYPNQWKIKVIETEDSELLETLNEMKEFSISGENCFEGLNKIYDTWGVGFIYTITTEKVDDGNGGTLELKYNTIIIGKHDGNVSNTFHYGKGNGIRAIKKNIQNADQLCTRAYVFGSTRNIPARWYNSKGYIGEAQYAPNLLIPPSKWENNEPQGAYIDAIFGEGENVENRIEKYGLKIKTFSYDGSDSNKEEIFPSVEKVTAKNIRDAKAELEETDNVPSTELYSDNERMDAVLEGATINDNGVAIEDGYKLWSDKINIRDYSQENSIIIAENTGETKYTTIDTVERISVCSFNVTKASKYRFTEILDFISFVKEEKLSTVSVDLYLKKPDGKYIQLTPSPQVISDELEGSVQLPDVVFNADIVGTYTLEVVVSVSWLSKNDAYPEYGDDRDLTLSWNTPDTKGDIIVSRGQLILDTFFSFKIKQIGFNINDMNASDGSMKKISFKSGMCSGRTFNIAKCVYSPDDDSWILTCRRIDDSSVSLRFPNSNFPVNTDDNFILLNINMPDLYVHTAMQRLYDTAIKDLKYFSNPQYVIEPEIDSIHLARNSSIKLRDGMYMPIEDEDLDIDATTEDKYILIDSVTITNKGTELPKFDVTLRNDKVVNKLKKIATQISELESIAKDNKSLGYISDAQDDNSAPVVNPNIQSSNTYSKAEIDGFLENKYNKTGGDIEGDANVIGKLSMGTLVIPNAEGVIGEYTLEVGELGEGADDVQTIAKIGDLENVNTSANDVSTEDVVLIKKGGSSEYIPTKVSDISVNENQIEDILINKKYVKQSDILTEDTTLIKKDLIPIERDVGIIIKNSGNKLTIGIDYNEDTFSIDDNNKLNLNNIDGGII